MSMLCRLRRLVPALLAAVAGCAAPQAQAPPPPFEALESLLGRYRASDLTLDLNADGTFRWYNHSGSLGERWDHRGHFTIKGTTLLLHEEEGRPLLGEWQALRFPRDSWYEFVKTADRVWLMDEWSWATVVNAGNVGPIAPLSGVPGFIRGDEPPPWQREEWPLPPPRWAARVLETPIEGRILEVDRFGRGRVDLGWRDGVFEGMVLLASNSRGTSMFSVEAVRRSSCWISGFELVPGMKVSSGREHPQD